MPKLHGASGPSSPMAPGAGGRNHEQMAPSAAIQQQQQQHHQQQYHQHPYDSARQPLSDPHHNGPAWAQTYQSAATSSASPSPRYGNSERSTSNALAESSNTSLLSSPAPPMPTTAASLMREGPRDFTVIKDVGDGSFGTVCLADWKSPLPSGTLLSPMQHPTTRPEYLGKRLVAIKKMKKPFPNWEECMKLKELKCLLAIPHHPNIIPLYDAFLMPVSKELHFVFECMEGNLYQLTKSRKGRPLAGGLVASIFQQIVKGLHHIHEQGYFHRDMKPENLLITTTGLADYPSSMPASTATAPTEKDVLVIVKLADFGLARETNSRPPYTEYVSTRWYRAPEVLLRSRDYSNPVDMWALGTILAELINLKPLFPGQSEVDQVLQICEILGDPTRDYGRDERGRLVGGGEWNRGLRMAKDVGFSFPATQPVTFSSLFSSKVPVSLIECIQDLIRYDPKARLTTQGCLDHVYYRNVAPRLQPPQARAVVAATTPEQQAMHARVVPRAVQMNSLASVMDPSAQRSAMPPSHSVVPQHSGKPAFGEATAPLARHATHQANDADVPMEAASPNADRGMGGGATSGDTQWAPAPGGPTRDSTISQYPAFPDSASLFAGSHASMQFDEVSMQAQGLEGDKSEAQFSSSTVRDPRQYAAQMSRPAALQAQQARRPINEEEMEMVQSQERVDYNRQAVAQLPSLYSQPPPQGHHLPPSIHNYDHGHLMYRHGRPSNQSIPTSLPESGTSGETDGKQVDANQSSLETVASKERERRKSKGWGINISSVLGGGGGASGSGSSGSHGRQQQSSGWSNGAEGTQKAASTPAQQLAAEHSDRMYSQQASPASLPLPPPMDPKKAKKVAEKAAREAEKKKRAAQEKAARERARAVMQKRNQILASSNSRDQVEWLTLADNDMTKALQPPISTPAPSTFQSETSRGKQSSVSQSSTSDHSAYASGPLYGTSSQASPYSSYGVQQGGVHSPAWQGQRSSSRGNVRRRDLEEEAVMAGGGGGGSVGGGYASGLAYASDEPPRQSMQSFHTGDSDPGPGRPYLSGAGLHSMQRQGSASSLNSAPGLIDGGASSRTRLGDRNSFDTRSVASSLDHQLIQNMENMTAAEGNRQRSGTGSTSPGPVHLVGQRPSVSRQSVGSRASSAHRQGSASPLHHQAAPRFHPYSVGGASNSTGNVALPSSAHSSYSFNLPSLASIAQGNASSDYVESLQSGSGAGQGTMARPRSMTRRSSNSIHRGPASRGSLASGDGPIQRGQHGLPAGPGPINPMFHVPTGHVKGPSPSSAILNGASGSGQQQQTLPPFSHLAAAAASTRGGEEDVYYSSHPPTRHRSQSASQR